MHWRIALTELLKLQKSGQFPETLTLGAKKKMIARQIE
jgi:hypothetical protein